MNTKIAFFDAKPYDIASFDKTNASYGFQITFLPVRLNEETASLAAGAQIVCAFVNDDMSAPVIKKLHELGVKLVALRSAGYNNVSLETAFGKIHVVRVPAYSPHAVAEHAVSLLLTLNRKTHKAYNRTRDGNFALNGLLGFDLYGKTAGIVGTGKIGKITAEILAGFGMKVLVSDPYKDETWATAHGIEYVDLDRLYRESRVISLHCPLTPENHHLINERNISLMQEGVILINTGRGALVDTKALVDALKSGKIGGAGLDVYEEEDAWFFEDYSTTIITDDVLARLLTFPNVLITSHQAFFTNEALEAIASTTLENVKLFAEKGALPNEICYHCAAGVTVGLEACPRKVTGRCF